MEEKVISKDEMIRFVDTLVRDYQVFAPTKEGSIVSFSEIDSGAQVFFGYTNSKRVPKEVFFPQSERMFEFHRGEEGMEVLEVSSQGGRVLFGVRPCDARGFVLLDKVFDSSDYKDVYYVDKRSNTVVFGLACNRPLSTCFCTSVGGAPFDKLGVDVFLTDLGDEYLVEVITEKGKALIERYDRFEDATVSRLELRDKLSRISEAAVKSKVNVEGIKEKLDGMFDDPFWDQLHLKCLGCALCTYLCSTCHCFDILDETVNSKGERVRNWDSCMFPLFTLQASGHNPRPSGKERMRQRIMHKFNYFVENYGEIACVGCGRCVINCPVNMDVRKVVNSLAARAEKTQTRE